MIAAAGFDKAVFVLYTFRRDGSVMLLVAMGLLAWAMDGVGKRGWASVWGVLWRGGCLFAQDLGSRGITEKEV
jgi:hypothetical protein